MSKNLIRFIAGATCPECKELDKIAITADDQTIYCLSCDFKEHKPDEGVIDNNKFNASEVFKIKDFIPKKS